MGNYSKITDTIVSPVPIYMVYQRGPLVVVDSPRQSVAPVDPSPNQDADVTIMTNTPSFLASKAPALKASGDLPEKFPSFRDVI